MRVLSLFSFFFFQARGGKGVAEICPKRPKSASCVEMSFFFSLPSLPPSRTPHASRQMEGFSSG